MDAGVDLAGDESRSLMCMWLASMGTISGGVRLPARLRRTRAGLSCVGQYGDGSGGRGHEFRRPRERLFGTTTSRLCAMGTCDVHRCDPCSNSDAGRAVERDATVRSDAARGYW